MPRLIAVWSKSQLDWSIQSCHVWLACAFYATWRLRRLSTGCMLYSMVKCVTSHRPFPVIHSGTMGWATLSPSPLSFHESSLPETYHHLFLLPPKPRLSTFFFSLPYLCSSALSSSSHSLRNLPLLPPWQPMAQPSHLTSGPTTCLTYHSLAEWYAWIVASESLWATYSTVAQLSTSRSIARSWRPSSCTSAYTCLSPVPDRI